MNLPPVETLTYEQAYAELELVVSALESNQRPLEDSLALFERGQSLARHCAALLDQAEVKIRTLTSFNQAEEEEYDPGE